MRDGTILSFPPFVGAPRHGDARARYTRSAGQAPRGVEAAPRAHAACVQGRALRGP